MIHELLPWMLAIGKYILASAVLLAFYRVFLRKRASYRESRFFLLSVAFVALAVSQFRIEVTNPAPTIVEVEQLVPEYSLTTGMTVPTGMAAPTGVAEPNGVAEPTRLTESLQGQSEVVTAPTVLQQTVTWIQTHTMLLLLGVYLLVALILLSTLLLQYLRLRNLRKTGMSSQHDGYTLIEHPEVSTPFSFATTIFLPSNMNANQRDIIVTHERWHISHKHYIDVLVQEITCCLLWFNPVQWLLRKDLRSVHEFQADRSVLNEGCDVYHYQTVILEEVLGHHFRLANGFNQSFTKKRFIQMKQFEPIRLTAVRKGLSVCFIVLLFAALSVVPGKSQVIKVERSSKTVRTENGTTTTTTVRTNNGTTTTVTTDSADRLPNFRLSNGRLSNPINMDPTASPSQLQQSNIPSLDSQQYMINRALPIARKLARSSHPAEDVSDMNALLEALNITVNKQSADYNSFSPEFKKSLTKQDFKGFEKTLLNMNDSIKLYRTYKIDRFDSPYALKTLTLAQMILSDNLMKKLVTESFTQLFREMGVPPEEMGNITLSLDGAEELDGMGEAFGEMGKAMTGMMSNLAGVMPTQTTTEIDKSQPVRSPRSGAERLKIDRSTMENERNARLKSISGMTNESALANIARNDDDPGVRIAAVRRMTNESSLASVSRNDEDRSVRLEAVLRLTNESSLASIARNDEDPGVRIAAVRRLTNQSSLASVARNDEDRRVRMEAILRLTNESSLASIARNDEDPGVRIAVVRRMINESSLASVARNDEDKRVRLEAVLRLTNESSLASIARNDEEPSVRIAAVRRLTNPSSLESIAKNDEDRNVRMEAVSRLGQFRK